MQHETQVWYRPPRDLDRYLPEGPRAQDNTLTWVNIQREAGGASGDIWVKHGPSEPERHELPARPGFALPTNEPGLLLAGCDKVLGYYSLFTREWQPLAALADTHPRTIINDAEVCPGGQAIVFGTKDVQFAEPLAHLYHFDLTTCRISVLQDQQICSNGKVFFRGDLYDIDTPRKVVMRYRPAAGPNLFERAGVALDLSQRVDYPDGMVLLADGSVIIAFYHPGRAREGVAIRYELDSGREIERWITPGSPRVTCPLVYATPEGVKLLLTTATEGMPTAWAADAPNAGCLFSADLPKDMQPAPLEVCRVSP